MVVQVLGVGRWIAGFAVVVGSAPAQGVGPRFVMDGPVQASGALSLCYRATAPGGRGIADLADLGGGPVDVLGERLYLGFGSALTLLRLATVPGSGVDNGRIDVPAALVPRHR